MPPVRTRCSFRGVIALVVLAAAVAAAVAPAGAGPVGCGAVLTADTTLDRDITDCPGDGLVVGAAGITVDLNGHVVWGTRTPGTAGIRNHGSHDVVIKNGEVDVFDQGVVLKAAKRNLLSDLSVEENTRAGISLTGSHHNRIVSNWVYFNATSERGHGILLRGSHGNRILGNEASGSGNEPPSAGIALYRSRGNRIQGNNGVDSFYGIALFDGSDKNAIFRNSAAGSDLGRNANGIAVFDSDQTLIRRNHVSSNSFDGIFIALGSRRTSLERNFAHQESIFRQESTDDGIDVDDPNTFIAYNLANENGDLGIEAVPGVRDGGGNRASGNGNPLQCVGVRCSP